jgi:hypothetical protein
MNNSTVTAPVEMPVIDSPLDPEVAEILGDDILLGAASSNKVQKVKAGVRSSSTAARAWTMGGRVD